MAGDAISAAVAGIQSVLIHIETVAAAVANRARFRLPQRSKIIRIGGSFRSSNATALEVMLEAGGVNLLTSVLSMIGAAPSAPVGAARNVAGALTLGTHSYKTTFVTAVGESSPSAKSNVITLAAPTALTAAAGVVVGDLDLGSHSYKVTFVGPDGESCPSAKSNVITLAAPAAATGALAGLGAGNVDNGTHSYKITFVNAGGESVASVKSNVVTVVNNAADGQIAVSNIPLGPAGTTARNIYRTAAGDAGPWLLAGTLAGNVLTDYNDNLADVGLGAAAPAGLGLQMELSAIPVGPAGTTARKLYRTVAGDAGDSLLVGTIPDNVTVVFTDNIADAALGAAAPAGAALQATATLPLGPTGTTSRKLYRTVAGDGGDHKLVATIANNTATSYTDNIADGALGASAPTADSRSDGVFQEATLAASGPEAVAKEAEITVDVDTLTGTSVTDLCLQIDLVRID